MRLLNQKLINVGRRFLLATKKMTVTCQFVTRSEASARREIVVLTFLRVFDPNTVTLSADLRRESMIDLSWVHNVASISSGDRFVALLLCDVILARSVASFA